LTTTTRNPTSIKWQKSFYMIMLRENCLRESHKEARSEKLSKNYHSHSVISDTQGKWDTTKILQIITVTFGMQFQQLWLVLFGKVNNTEKSKWCWEYQNTNNYDDFVIHFYLWIKKQLHMAINYIPLFMLYCWDILLL